MQFSVARQFALTVALGLLSQVPTALGASEGGHEPGIWEGGVGNSIITLVIFGGVLLILSKYAWAPLTKALREREFQIRTSLENARQERIAAEKLLAEYKRQIERAREEATAIVEEGRRDATDVRRRMQEDARRESDEMLQRAKREIQLATDAAIKSLYDQTAELAVSVAGRIIHKELSPGDHRQLVTESLERMRAGQN